MDSFESNHHLGENFHVFDKHSVLQTILAKIGSPKVSQPLLGIYLNKAYEFLLSQAICKSIPHKSHTKETRMISMTDKGLVSYLGHDENTLFSVIDLARAGTEPSQTCYESLNYLFKPENIRQDHIYVNRKVDENSKVIGVDMSGSKIGGDFKDRTVIIPDPMGATGGTIVHTINYLKDNFDCDGAQFVIVHLIMTPEYVRRIKKENVDVQVFCGRYDRGLSSPKVLNSKYGEFLREEKGLSDIQYIIPGAGGMGEVLNNSFV